MAMVRFDQNAKALKEQEFFCTDPKPVSKTYKQKPVFVCTILGITVKKTLFDNYRQ